MTRYRRVTLGQSGEQPGHIAQHDAAPSAACRRGSRARPPAHIARGLARAVIRRLSRGLVRRLLGSFGLELRRRPPPPPIGADLGTDLQRLLGGTPHPVVFDIGANVGEFLTRIRVNLPAAVMHVFEPSPEVFQVLQRTAGELPGVTLNNIAMGPRREERLLQEHTASQMSSLLPPGPAAWSEVRRETSVRVETVDAYCAERGIPSIDLLKIDTQGYDLEVLRGAERMVADGRARLDFINPRPDEIAVLITARRRNDK